MFPAAPRPDSEPGEQVQAANANLNPGDSPAEERRHEVPPGRPRRRPPVPDPARPVACSGSALSIRSEQDALNASDHCTSLKHVVAATQEVLPFICPVGKGLFHLPTSEDYIHEGHS